MRRPIDGANIAAWVEYVDYLENMLGQVEDCLSCIDDYEAEHVWCALGSWGVNDD